MIANCDLQQQQTTPARCVACDQTLEVPVVCYECHSLFSPGPAANHSELPGLEPGYAIEAQELRRRFLNVSREVHPDRFSGKPAEVVRLSLNISARLNRAYQVLCDPRLRADYLLELCGGSSAVDDKSVPQSVLMHTLELHEEMEQSRADGNHVTLERIEADVSGEYDVTMATIADLAGGLPGGDEAGSACSRCHVHVKQGHDACNDATDDEEDQLDDAYALSSVSRLACQCVPDGTKDVMVEIPTWNRNLARE